MYKLFVKLTWFNFMMVTRIWGKKTILFSILFGEVILILKTFVDSKQAVPPGCTMLLCSVISHFILELSFAPCLIQLYNIQALKISWIKPSLYFGWRSKGTFLFSQQKLYFEQI